MTAQAKPVKIRIFGMGLVAKQRKWHHGDLPGHRILQQFRMCLAHRAVSSGDETEEMAAHVVQNLTSVWGGAHAQPQVGLRNAREIRTGGSVLGCSLVKEPPAPGDRASTQGRTLACVSASEGVTELRRGSCRSDEGHGAVRCHGTKTKLHDSTHRDW